MSILGDNVDAAIRASGKTAEEIARVLKVDKNTISRLRSGKEDNPKLQLLLGIARETNTTPAALLAQPMAIAPADEQELLRLRGWIDSKLMTLEAEPNAEILRAPAPVLMRESRVADRPRQPVEQPFGQDAPVVLRAMGESMIHAGIAPDDTLYAASYDATTGTLPVGRIIACRLHQGTFVKRLVSEHGRRFLLSAHSRYRPIALEDAPLEILGIVIGRTGRVT
jgi:SOS-response transcriptional repressor LexA